MSMKGIYKLDGALYNSDRALYYHRSAVNQFAEYLVFAQGRAFECYPMGDKMRVVFYMGGHGYDVFMSVAEFMQCVEYSQARINGEE